LEDLVLADADELRSQVTDEAGCAFFPVLYAPPHDNGFAYRVSVQQELSKSLDEQVQLFFSERGRPQEAHDREGMSLALLVWPSILAIDDEFRPDTVRTLGDLEELAAKFKCRDALRIGAARLRRAINRSSDVLRD